MPWSFLHPSPQRQGPLYLHPARAEDLDAIRLLLENSNRAYSGLGGAMREALQEDIALTAWQDNELAGFLLAYQQGPQSAWIHGLGLAPDVAADDVAQALLRELEGHLLERGVTWIGYMDEYGLAWVRRLLEKAGFQHNTRVVSYEMPIRRPPTRGNRTVFVRPAGPADLPAIARLDHLAFGPLWAYREQILRSILGQVPYFQVAVRGEEIVGYILCTAYNGDRVHIVRLAVDPPAQGQGIASRLLAEALEHFAAAGAAWVSLNTQEENRRSQRLYRWFGFRPTGDDMGVWTKELAG